MESLVRALMTSVHELHSPHARPEGILMSKGRDMEAFLTIAGLEMIASDLTLTPFIREGFLTKTA